MCESFFTKSNGVFTLPPLLNFIFVRIWPLAIFKQKLGGLYAYQLVSCVDSLIRVGVEN